MKTGIYKITNTLNGNLYIGLSKNLTQRMSEHKSRYLDKNRQSYESPLYRAFRKHGIENFLFEVIERCEEEKLVEREIFWISFYNSYLDKKHYNLTPGGEGNVGYDAKGSKNPRAVLTEEDVRRCRKLYLTANVRTCREVWEKDYQEVITYNGFRNMWRGRSWPHIMPEVFEERPTRTLRAEEVKIIRQEKELNKNPKEVYQKYKTRIQYNTFLNVWEGRTWKDV